MNRQIETPIHGSYFATSRSLDGNRVENQHLRLAEQQERLSELKNRLIELKIRFDSNPSRYQKEDYQKLIDILTSALLYLYNDLQSKIVTSWSSELSDGLVPSEKLVKETIDDLEESLTQTINQVISDLSNETNSREQADAQLDRKIDQETQNRISEIERLSGLIQQEAENIASVRRITLNKQDKLTAGDNISITNNVISAVDTIYDDSEIKSDISDLYQNKQDKLVAGDGIDITNNVISNTRVSAEWGNITGDITDQTDLQVALNLKANKSELPTKTSQLTNDSGFLTQHQDISNKANKSEIPTKVSQLQNDSGYLTQHQDISGKANVSDIPTNVSELNNDAGYLIAHQSLKTINNESLVGNGNISITFPELEFASEADVEQVVPLLPEMVTEIVNGTFDNSCLESFTGNSQYVPMSSEDVHNIIENVFNNEEEYGTSDSES